MTGIERLREFAETRPSLLTCNMIEELRDIADQIERELREALGGEKHDQANDVSMSAYDLLPEDERDAIAWVREHGGLAQVEADYAMGEGFSDLADEVARRLGLCIDGLDAQDSRPLLMDALDRRLMPEGCEWPRYEDGPLLRYGDSYIGNDGDNHRAWQIRFDSNADVHVSRGEDGDGFDRTTWDHFDKGERVKRPSVLAADGEPLEVGQTVYSVNDGTEYKVGGIRDTADVDGDLCKIIECSNDELHIYYACFPPDKLTHQRPVLDADGVPIKVGDTVWEVGTVLAIPMTVVEVSSDLVRCEYTWKDGKTYRPCYPPDQLTHTKPERDSWERVEEDKGLNPFDYCKKVGHKLWTFDNAEEFKASDLVRRCRALAERERGE